MEQGSSKVSTTTTTVEVIQTCSLNSCEKTEVHRVLENVSLSDKYLNIPPPATLFEGSA